MANQPGVLRGTCSIRPVCTRTKAPESADSSCAEETVLPRRLWRIAHKVNPRAPDNLLPVVLLCIRGLPHLFAQWVVMARHVIERLRTALFAQSELEFGLPLFGLDRRRCGV